MYFTVILLLSQCMRREFCVSDIYCDFFFSELGLKIVLIFPKENKTIY